MVSRSGDAHEAKESVLSGRVVVRLLVVLAAASGCLDVFCLTRLGGFFASVITGNLVQFGHAVATAETPLLAGGATAVGGYAVGVAGGTLALRHVEPGWRRRTGVVAAAEAVLLAGVAVGWSAAGARPEYAGGLALLAGAPVANGMQSVVTISSGVRGASTTYLTGSLTGVVRSVVLDPHRFAAGAGGISRLLGLLGGAVLGALTLRVAPVWAPALAAALVVRMMPRARSRSWPSSVRRANSEVRRPVNSASRAIASSNASAPPSATALMAIALVTGQINHPPKGSRPCFPGRMVRAKAGYPPGRSARRASLSRSLRCRSGRFARSPVAAQSAGLCARGRCWRRGRHRGAGGGGRCVLSWRGWGRRRRGGRRPLRSAVGGGCRRR